MRPLPLLSAAAAVALVVAAAGSATAAPTVTTPAAGDATSGLVLGQVVAAGSDVAVGTLSLVSDTTGATPVARVVVTPLSLDGTAYGTQEVTPANSPQTVAAPTTGLPAGLGGVTGPTFTVSAATPAAGPTTSAGSTTLGSLSLLGLSIPLDGTVSAGSSVLGTGASSGKAFEVRNLALPSIADLLEVLGLDLDLLGQIVPGVLAQLVDLLGLPIDPALLADLDDLLAAQDLVDDAQAAVDAAQAELDTATAALQAAEDALAPAQALLDQLETAETDALADVATAQAAVDAVPLLDCTVSLLDPLCVALADATAAADAASDAVTAQEGVVAPLAAAVVTAQDLVDDLQLTLDGLVATLEGLLQDVLDLVAGLPGLVAELVATLDGVSLLSLDELSVVTSAQATSASPGGQKAEVVGGELVGLEVLGTDVLALPEVRTALGLAEGDNGVDVAGLVGAQLDAVQAAIDELTGILTGVLDGAVPGLSVPAIEVAVLERTTSTAITGGFGVATAGIGGLRIGIPAITVPDLTALLPVVLTAAAVNDVSAQAVSQPVTVTLGAMSESARFRPAVLTDVPATGTPTTATPTGSSLPATGAPALVAVLGLVLVAAAALVRRRSSSGD